MKELRALQKELDKDIPTDNRELHYINPTTGAMEELHTKDVSPRELLQRTFPSLGTNDGD